MKIIKKYCDRCGKLFNGTDDYYKVEIDIKFSNKSQYDGDIHLDICSDCSKGVREYFTKMKEKAHGS